MADHNPVGFTRQMDGTLSCRIQVDELNPVHWIDAVVRDNNQLRHHLMGTVGSFEAVFDKGGTIQRGTITKAQWTVKKADGTAQFNITIENHSGSFSWHCTQQTLPGPGVPSAHTLVRQRGTGYDRIPSSIVGELVGDIHVSNGGLGPFVAQMIYLEPQA